MFPNGNIESEKSRFSENVPAWVLLAAGLGLPPTTDKPRARDGTANGSSALRLLVA